MVFTYEFEYIPSTDGDPVMAKFEQDDEVINVTVDDQYVGSMVEDDNAEFGYSTNDTQLQDELEGLIMAFKEADAIDNLPAALHEIYGHRLTGWTWTDTKDLKLIAHPDNDLNDLADELTNQINEIVLFDKPLTIYLSKEDSGEVKEIHIN